ncbi:sulfite reductase flavoprotein subunit alpha [Stenotrophomonas sp.]|uniref:sulfite reductase flavoprotein subunit alpha n=1 Tax=Stenotrophomonas sp. TaxID=69392 RepID=UPI00289E5CF8|nr:sulfite reductase flavoprotein subunit alpha [Stenotrophomonas sp.]
MFKNILFQLHWLLGITAGTVLAIMGLSGATLSFEDEIVRALNPDVADVAQRHAAGEQPLALSELLPRLQEGTDRPLQRLRVDATGQRLSVARFEGGKQHWRYFNPYTGHALDDLRGLAFFDFVEDLHRHLVAGDRGKLITGICAITLVFFALSGLYLRWPRQWWHWRTWLAVEWSRSGRSFLWSLHSVVGTWVLVVYLLLALTGLWWSFDWYRSGATQLLGGPSRDEPALRASQGALDMARVERTLYALPGVRQGYIDLRFPNKPGRPLSGRVQSTDAAHDRAQDNVQLDPVTGALLEHEPYRQMSAGRKTMTSMFALHSGSFFGLPGRVIIMLSSLAMLLFFITGWMLYLDRRRKKRQVRASRVSMDATAAEGQRPWLVAFASQSGFAEQLAWRAAAQLQGAGMAVQVRPLGQLDAASLQDTHHALFVVSTFGDGEAPDAARVFERRLLPQSLALGELRYALLGLGDSEYARYCGFSREVDAWLSAQGAQRVFDTVEVDRDDSTALGQWQQQLGQLTGIDDVAPLPAPEPLQDWMLQRRTLLNPGSAAGAIWEICLLPPAHANWQAGDILEIVPGSSDTGPGETLPALPHREYSIASVMQDDCLQLVVRLTQLPDGRHGLGSGWLCVHATEGAPIQARVRRNTGFHRFPEHAPMLLIGNGTGIAGLRSLLREAAAHGDGGHWLVFGERTAAHDSLYHDELETWLQHGHLRRLDRVFSRDADGGGYVQHRLQAQAQNVRDWVAMGGSIYVCGSLHGMAEGVDRVLRETLGEASVDVLLVEGRYRRDVY